MQSLVGPRLSLMMFLQFFMWGVWWVPLAIYMGTEEVGMAAIIGTAYLSQPIGAMISPFFLGLVADRYFPTEKVLAVLHILGGALLLAVPYYAQMPDGTGQTMFITMIILHMLCYMPTIGLTNAIAFNTMTDPGKQFPIIRVFGTIGWIASGLLVGFGLNYFMTATAEHTVWPFYLGAGAGFILGLYSLTLPHTPPPLKGQKPTLSAIIGLDAVRQLSSQSFWTFIIASMLICIPLAAYYSFAGLYAGHAGMEQVSGWMSTGQMSELLFMLLMPFAFSRLGVKWMLLIGMMAWVARYALFAIGAPEGIFPLILVGIILHGICYDFFFVTGMIYVEKRSSPAIRAQAQGFLVQMTLGVGMFVGMLVSGSLFNSIIGESTGAERLQNYQLFWAIPALFAFFVMIGFWLLFKDDIKPAAEADVDEEDIATAAAVDEQP
ncbi:MAG: MFS transporter [Phycisphaeraceae bacterium]